MLDLALCIGVDHCRLAPALSFAARDARLLAELLHSRDTEVRLCVDEDATLAEVRAALDALAACSRPRSRVLVSYSGHGGAPRRLAAEVGSIRSERRPRTACLAAYDGLLGGEELLGRLNSIVCSELTLIVDACHSIELISDSLHVFEAGHELEPSTEEIIGQGGIRLSRHLRFLSSAALGAWAVERRTGETLMSKLVEELRRDPQVGLWTLCARLACNHSPRERVYGACGAPDAFHLPLL